MIAKATIEINAPIDIVWSVILDFKNYQQWNPFIYEVKNVPDQLEIGSRFQLLVRWADGSTADSWETVTHLSAPSMVDEESSALLTYRYSSWLARYGLVRAFREQHLIQRSGQMTIYRTQETFHGILARFLPLSSVQDGFQRHAQALKQYAELTKRLTP